MVIGFTWEPANLNLLSTAKTLTVLVTDSSGLPASGANVEFGLYNYAEFYPIASVETGGNGTCKFETGFGDLVVWASAKGLFAYSHVPAAFTDTLRLALLDSVPELTSVDIDLEVPPARVPFQEIPSELAKKNKERVDKGIIIRQDYINGWMSPSEAAVLARSLSLDTSRVMSAIGRSMGNYREIARFIEAAPDTLGELALEILETLPDKDLRDTKSGILLGHLKGCSLFSGNYSAEGRKFLIENVINPRIANELLSDWRTWFLANLPESLFRNAASDPSVFVAYLNNNVIIAEEENYYKTPLTPGGVVSLGVSDASSRAICFVALCRTAGMASRLEPGTSIPQYYKNDNWEYAWFNDQIPVTQLKGNVTLVAEGKTPEPEYYTHFTFARLENGRFRTLHFNSNVKVSGFDNPLALLPGHYMLVTGNRLANGSVLARLSFFSLKPGENLRVDVALRQEATAAGKSIEVDLTPVLKLLAASSDGERPVLDKGLVLVWAEPETEPSEHILNDIRSLKKEFDSWGGCFLFLTGEDSKISGYRPGSVPGLPANSLFAVDISYTGLAGIVSQIPGENISIPFLLLTDHHGNVAYTSSGYRIGTGEQILKNMNLPVNK
ncbi:MAG: hypothetical protein MUD02_06665 [Bacteroidales bacterium]|nr:hypothetical protein [Bacteroidales bacterium]